MPFYQPKRLPNLMVAPNGARKVKKDHPEVPLTIKETVEVAKTCFEAGAKGSGCEVEINWANVDYLDLNTNWPLAELFPTTRHVLGRARPKAN